MRYEPRGDREQNTPPGDSPTTVVTQHLSSILLAAPTIHNPVATMSSHNSLPARSLSFSIAREVEYRTRTFGGGTGSAT